MLNRVVITAAALLATISTGTCFGQLLQMGMDDVGWEAADDSGPLLYRDVTATDLVSVRAKITAQTVGFWSQSGVIVRVPNPIDAAAGQENWQTSWSFRGTDPAEHQSNSHVDGVETEFSDTGLPIDELMYVRLDNLGGGEFQAFRGMGTDDSIVWTPHDDGTQTNANLSSGTVQVGLAGGAIGPLPNASVLFDWVEIETTSQVIRDDFDYVHDFTTGVPGFDAGATSGGGIWNGVENAAAGGIPTTTGPDLGRCFDCFWDSVGSDDFNDPNNWSPVIHFVPNGNDVTATFGDVLDDMGMIIRTEPSTVFTNTEVTLKELTFDSSVGYVFGGTGSITLEADTGNAAINVQAGTHEIQANVVLNSNTTATAAMDAVLEVNAEVDLHGNTLTIGGAGAVNLNNGVLLGGGQLVNGVGSLAGLSSVDGDFTQTADGSLAMEAGGETINVLGAANLAGTINVTLAEGLALSPGDIYTILTASSVTDAGLQLGTGANQFRLLVGTSGVSLVAAIPEPSAVCLLTLGLMAAGLGWHRRPWPGHKSYGRRSFATCVILVSVLYCGTAAVQAQCPECGLFRDDFDVFHDYSGAMSGGDPGTVPAGGIWDGIHNPINGGDEIEPGFFVANGEDAFGTPKPGVLFLEDLNIHVNTSGALGVGWEGQANNAPFLFKEVPAHRDFTATIKIDAETNGNWSHTPILARISGPEVGRGPGDTIDDENFVNVGSFRATDVPENATLLMQSVIDGDETETNQNLFPAGEGGAPLPVWVRLDKNGQLFTGSMSLDGIDFASNNALSFVNDAFVEGATMEVGLGHWRYFNSTPGEAEIDFFEIEIRESVRHTTSEWGGGSESWNLGTNWNSDAPASIPNANSVTATLGEAATGPTSVYNDEAVVLRGLVFNSTNTYAITGHGSITLEPDPQGADSTTRTSIDVMQGSHELQVDLGFSGSAANDNHFFAEAGARLNINSPFNLNGKQVTVTGAGQLNFNNNIDTGTTGTIINDGGHVGGSGRINGALTNGQAGGADSHLNPGTSIGTLTVDGTFRQNASGILEFDLGGTEPGEFDVLRSLGPAFLMGTLDVSLVDGFLPAVGDMFEVLTATALISPTIAIAPEDADFYNLIAGSNNLTLEVIKVPIVSPDLFGDYNEDGVVNAADYVVWRNNLGSDGSLLPNRDPTASGLIGQGDYDFWKANYGNIGGAASQAAIPEPNSLALLMIVGVLVSISGRLKRL